MIGVVILIAIFSFMAGALLGQASMMPKDERQ